MEAIPNVKNHKTIVLTERVPAPTLSPAWFSVSEHTWLGQAKRVRLSHAPHWHEVHLSLSSYRISFKEGPTANRPWRTKECNRSVASRKKHRISLNNTVKYHKRLIWYKFLQQQLQSWYLIAPVKNRGSDHMTATEKLLKSNSFIQLTKQIRFINLFYFLCHSTYFY